MKVVVKGKIQLVELKNGTYSIGMPNLEGVVADAKGSPESKACTATLDMDIKYLHMEKIRFGDTVTVTIEIGEEEKQDK